MSKIRIYELAKELGVDNRVIISAAQALGMQGKSSHSHSLEDDEAEQLRRHVLRDAVGGAKAQPKKVETYVQGDKTVTVDRSKGLIIRRKRDPNEPEVAPVVPAAVAPTPVEPELSVVPEPVIDASSPVAQEMTAEPEPVTASADMAQGGLAVNLQPEVSSAVVDERQPEVAPPAAVAAQTPAPRAPVMRAREEPVSPTSLPGFRTSVADGMKGVGPKVLGRIDLPAPKPAPVAREARAPAGGASAPAAAPSDGSGRPGAHKKKTKRREISRLDLLDYQDREGRRAKPGRGRKGRDDAPAEARPEMDAAALKAAGIRRTLELGERVTVGDLAKGMSLKAGEVIQKLMDLGMLVTINQVIDQETATIVADEFGFDIKSTTYNETQAMGNEQPDAAEDLVLRSPVVTVMGHVDHGKTTLLDSIRNASVAAKEHGGITQHIGAYRVTLPDGRAVSFIDTPGHAAFTAMRARGAKITDIVILVVAADDGLMPQTIEAINHARAAQVPMIVAINKVDKPDANAMRVRQQLVEQGIQPEDWGGDTMFFEVSALKKQGIKELLEGCLLLAEVKELKANPKRRAKGAIIEAKQERGRGIVATVLVQNGTLRVGDIFVSGCETGRVRSMVDAHGERMEEAGPSMPVEITGLSGVPDAGDDFLVVESDQVSREVVANRLERKALLAQRASGPISLEEFAKRANNMAVPDLCVIVKADVHGSLEAVKHSLEQLPSGKVRARVVHSGVGAITESDVQLAISSHAIIVGFNVRAETRAAKEAETVGVEMRFYRIIYDLLDDIRKAMAGMLSPVRKEKSLGRAEVREVFAVSKLGNVAGCFVTTGVAKRTGFARVVRDGRTVYEGKLGSLKRFKDDVSEVQNGFECGMSIDRFNDVKVGDVLELYEFEEHAATID